MIATQYPAALAKLDFGPTWLSLSPLGESVDPFNFEQRLALYKRVIDDSNAQGIFGDENQFNLFWGYVVQLYWQWQSQRLVFPETPQSRIDPDSLWSYGNHGLSLIPYIGAVRAGVTPEIEILPPYKTSQAQYAYGGGKAGAFVIPPNFEPAVKAWQGFFRQLRDMRKGEDLEALRFKQWEAHHLSLDAGKETYRKLAVRYSRNEYDFFFGWIRMVDFLGTAAWHTDLEYMLQNGMGVLPERLVTDDDQLGESPDLSPEVNANVRSVVSLTRQSKWRFNLNLWLWKRAMRTRQARDEVLPMLDATFSPSPRNAPERRKLLRYILKW
jgi:hypothetical protein